MYLEERQECTKIQDNFLDMSVSSLILPGSLEIFCVLCCARGLICFKNFQDGRKFNLIFYLGLSWGQDTTRQRHINFQHILLLKNKMFYNIKMKDSVFDT